MLAIVELSRKYAYIYNIANIHIFISADNYPTTNSLAPLSPQKNQGIFSITTTLPTVVLSWLCFFHNEPLNFTVILEFPTAPTSSPWKHLWPRLGKSGAACGIAEVLEVLELDAVGNLISEMG